MELYERIKYLRKTELKLTQKEFAEKLGVSRSVISNIEYNVLAQPDRQEPIYRLICSTFNVNYTWLKNGDGDIFIKSPTSFIDELAQKYNIDDFLKRVITAYMDLSENDRQTVRRYIENIAPSSGGVRIYRAASSEEDHPDEITTISDDDHRRLAEAPRTSSEESDL